MKKLFYIILVVVALMVISRFVKQEKSMPEPATTIAQETMAVETCNCNAEQEEKGTCACSIAAETCNCDAEMKESGTCACAADSTDGIGSDAVTSDAENNADGIVVEENIEEIEEMDPSSTQNDDETIIKE